MFCARFGLCGGEVPTAQTAARSLRSRTQGSMGASLLPGAKFGAPERVSDSTGRGKTARSHGFGVDAEVGGRFIQVNDSRPHPPNAREARAPTADHWRVAA